LSSYYIFSKVDIDLNDQVATHFGVRSIPEYVIMDSTLRILGQKGGTMSISQLRSFLRNPLKSPAQEKITIAKSDPYVAPSIPIITRASTPPLLTYLGLKNVFILVGRRD
jgi:hypothetical protein